MDIMAEKVLSKINSKLESYKSLIVFVYDCTGHDRCYAIDAINLENELGWKADRNFDRSIIYIINWFFKKYKEQM